MESEGLAYEANDGASAAVSVQYSAVHVWRVVAS